MDYQEFLLQKQKNVTLSGFDIDEKYLTDSLFPFQKFCVRRALKAGKYGICADCGLGKTIMQLEWSRSRHGMRNGRVAAALHRTARSLPGLQTAIQHRYGVMP